MNQNAIRGDPSAIANSQHRLVTSVGLAEFAYFLAIVENVVEIFRE